MSINRSGYGNPTVPVKVFFRLDGNADEFTDYTTDAIGGTHTLPARAWRSQETMTVMPAGDVLEEVDEVVVIQLDYGAGYSVGDPRLADLSIADDALAAAPAVSAIVPDHGGDNFGS